MRQPAWMDGMHSVWGFLWPCGFEVPPGHHPNCNASSPVPSFRITLKHAVNQLLAGGLLLFGVSAAHATAPVGATPGAFAVSPSGAATYSIPIFVPPGTHGMQPQLSLNYNSQGGNGLLGMGWSIGGLSVIHRCGSTIAIDGIKGGVNYDANDKFCLDGERLINIGGAEYRTQHESWQQIVAVGGTASDPGYFTVTAKDGTVQYYGATADSRIEAQGGTVARLWALNKVQDRNGNYLTIAYQEENAVGDFRPASIAYTGNGSIAPYNYVYFDYPTALRSDVIQAYEGGSLISTTKLLTGVRTCTNTTCTANNGLVRQYTLSYLPDGAAGRLRLKTIQECGSDGVCLPATTFISQDGGNNADLNTSSVSYLVSGGSPSDRWFTMADVNGDSKTDSVLYDPATGYVNIGLSAGNGTFGGAVSSYFASGGSPSDRWFTMADVNGDGSPDAVLYNPSSGYITISLSNGNGTFAGATSTYLRTCSMGNSYFNMADVNGDGRADAVLYVAGSAYVYLSTGNGAFAGAIATYGVGYVFSTSTAWFIMADVNGDGRADAVLRSAFYSTNYDVNVYLSNGNGTFGFAGWTNIGYSGTPTDAWFIMADVNGDDRMDVVSYKPNTGNASVFLSTGNGAFTAGVSTYIGSGGSPSDRWFTLADVNGDGKPDAVLYNPSDGYANVFLSIGNGAFAARVSTYIGAGGSPSDRWFEVADVTGDGKADAALYTPSVGNINSFTALGLFPDILTSITNGLGAQVNISYKPSTDNTVYTKDSNSVYPYRDLQNATYVVSQFTQSDGIGGVNTTSYQYRGLKFHHEAAANLGFRQIETTDPAGLVHVTNHNQTLDGTEGTVASGESLASGVPVKYVGNTWIPVNLGAGRCYARLASTVEETRELDNSLVTTVNTSYSGYDTFNNPGSVTVNFATGGVSDGWSKTTANIYNNDTVNWQLGQLLQSQVTANAPGQSAQIRTSSFT